MRRGLLITACLFKVLVLLSCSARNNNVPGNYVIRYVSMNAVFDYVYNNSNEAQELKRKSDTLVKKIDEMENSSEKISRPELVFYKSELAKIRDQEKKLKSEFYLRIKNAINAIATRYNADFVLNSGDGVIYSRSEFDITSDVLREIKNQESRRSPAFK